MILLSRLIKSHFSHPQHEEKKVIQLQPLSFRKFEQEEQESSEAVALRMKQEAEGILQRAKFQAEQIMNDAQISLNQTQQLIEQLKQDFEAEKQALSELAREQGFQEGLILGKEEGNKQFLGLIDEAASIVEKTKSDYLSQVEKSEETILKLGIKVAEKILHVHLKEKKEDFIHLVKHAIKEVKDYADVTIIVHPYMYELVASQKDELQALFNNDKNLYIYPDSELQETCCMIESSFGRIDVSIDSQLAELKIKLLELLEEE
jgi:flagellar assembly protein FliH